MRQSVEEFQKKQKENTDKESADDITKQDFSFNATFNPDAYTNYIVAQSESTETENAFTRELSSFTGRILSQLLLDIVRFSTTMPSDSQSLTNLFHQRGLNMRYLGKIAELFDQLVELQVPFFKDLCVEEMFARAAKVLLREYLKDTPMYLVKDCVSQFFNCLLSDNCEKLASKEMVTVTNLRTHIHGLASLLIS
jgi:protein TIF31